MKAARFASAVCACLLGALLLGASCNQGTRALTTPNGSTLELPAGFEPIMLELGEVLLSTDDASYTVNAEFAVTQAARTRGLMFRTALPEDAGMLFLFEEDQRGGFWMFNTLVPLSVAYIDARGLIVDIAQMAPCGNEDPRVPRDPAGNPCPSYPSAAPYRYALEVNRGYFAERGIGVGDSVSFER